MGLEKEGGSRRGGRAVQVVARRGSEVVQSGGEHAGRGENRSESVVERSKAADSGRSLSLSTPAP
eukprot:scaffold179218_cov24-Tisochrysis_lutea.AAC.1